MVKDSHRFRDEVKLYKVIESCKTSAQCSTAWGYIEAFENWYDLYHCAARNTLGTKEFVVGTAKKLEVVNET